MGRRKLPSLPQPYMGTNSINAPIYYTSSGPEKNEIPNGIINTSGGSIVFDPSTASTTTRLTSAARIQPQISSSRPSSSLGTHPVDPSILPGATFKVMQKSRQITMIPNGDLANNKQKKLPKMTDTMSRVMLKKELREVLLKRRDKLDACEIEANNRQYVINRMLNSGILPENRLSELNEIPAVIKCDLPEDIVKGARVVPLRRPQIQTNIDSRFSKSQSQNTSVNWMHEEGTRQFKINTTNNRETKSIATQCEAPPKSVGTSTNLSYSTRYAPSTSLKQQIRAESTDFGQHLSKQRTVETQTDAIVDSTRPKKFPEPSGIPSLPIRGTSTAASGPDLLESTQRYFDEYDRRLKEAASIRLEKQRFNFTDNDIESKRQQILNELAQRREKISSMVDLRYLQQQPTNRLANQPLPSSDYASTVPHYGSLPRIDYPARNRISPNSQIRDFTARQSQPYSYSSLPRNYERNLNMMEQTLYGIPQSSRIPSNMSRSLYNLDQLDSGYSQYMQQNQIPQQQQPYARSSNYVDQLGSMDDLFTTTRNTNPNTGVDGGNMLSQYANYLNNQFLLAQQNQFENSLTDEYNLNATLPPPSSFGNFGYEQQPSNLYQTNLQNQMLPNMPPPPTQPQIYDNFPNSQVYSRQEHNYGSRPSQFVGDYGNYLHNRAQSLRQLDNLQDFVNHNVGVLPNVGLPANSNPPTYGYYPSPWDNGFNSNYIAAQQQQQQPRLLQQQQQFQQQQQQQQLQQQQLQQQPQYQPQMRSTTNTSYYDAKYPREDGLNRMYQTYGRRHRSPYNNISTNSDYLQNSQFSTSSLGRNMRSKPNNSITSASRGRSMNNIGREINDLLREHPSPGRSHRIPQRRIKRLLLTRRYKDTNVYNDLGIRVTGGKKLPNGDLGAFVTSVNRGKPFETLFEIQEGDQVLEWNGIILNGRTFEEVERIIASSKGEIEIIIKSNNGQEPQPFPKAENVYDNVSDNVRQAARRFPNDKSYWQTRSEAPPVPAHRSLSPNYYGNSESNMMLPYDSQRQYYPKSLRDGLGSIQIALSYDQVNGILLVTVVSARNLRCREYNNTIIAPNPFVKVYLLPGRKVSNKRRTKYISNTANPEWQQTVEYLVNFHDIPSYYLELTVWNYDKYNDNICLGQVNLSLSDTSLFNNMTRSYPLQSPDQASVIHGLNNTPAAPTTRLRTQSYYNPSSLDLGYPAIC